MNSVELQGRITNIYKGSSVTIITLFVKGNNGNNLPQIIFNYSEKDLVEHYKKNDFVHITGSMKVRAVKTPDGKNYFQQYVRGYVIYPVHSEMSEKFKRDLDGLYEYKNEVLIEGTIESVNDKNGVLNFMIKPIDEKVNLWLSNYTKNPNIKQHSVEIGSKACIKCEIQTVRKEKEGQKAKFYENLVIKYMSIPKENDKKYGLDIW